MKLDMVGCTPGELLDLQREILERLSGNDGNVWLGRYKRLHQWENPFAELVEASAPADAWKDELVGAMRKKLARFSRHWARQVLPVPDAWTPEFLARVGAYNMRPVFFPDVDINKTFRRKGYVKPEPWFYDQARARINGDTLTKLRKGWALADFTVGTDYTNGTQVFPGDPWTGLITELRQKKLVGRYDNTPPGSRFSITWDEWNSIALVYMASKLGVTRAQMSLERAVEFNFLGNVYDNQRGRFNMWEWFVDMFGGGRRLIGGTRGGGGLANASYYRHGDRHPRVAGRPLVRFL